MSGSVISHSTSHQHTPIGPRDGARAGLRDGAWEGRLRGGARMGVSTGAAHGRVGLGMQGGRHPGTGFKAKIVKLIRFTILFLCSNYDSCTQVCFWYLAQQEVTLNCARRNLN